MQSLVSISILPGDVVIFAVSVWVGDVMVDIALVVIVLESGADTIFKLTPQTYNLLLPT